MLDSILDNPSWQEAFSKREEVFAVFLTEFAKGVNKSVIQIQYIPWQDIPGYNALIKHFLIELKKRDIKKLPKYLIDASVSLLLNEKLLNIFIGTVFSKTSVFDTQNVFSVLELTNTWLKTFRDRQVPLPTTFDYSFFLKGLYVVMDSDHAFNTAKALWVIYSNYGILPSKSPLFALIYKENILR